MPAGNGLADPYSGAADRSPPIPGAAASPATRRRARPARPTRPARRQRRSHAFFGTRDSRPISPWRDEHRHLYGSGRMGLLAASSCTMRQLATAAGGVDAFIIGSEMRGLSWVRDSASTYPFVAALIDAGGRREGDAAARHAKVTYAADWSRVFRPPAGRRLGRRLSSTSTRSGPTPTSTRSASTITGRSPTGATALRISTTRRARASSTISPI